MRVLILDLFTLSALVFLPGLAVLSGMSRRVKNTFFATAFLPVPGLLLLGAFGLLLWLLDIGLKFSVGTMFRHTTLCAATAYLVLNVGFRQRPFPRLHLLAIGLYVAVVLVALSYSFLDVNVPFEFFEQTT